VTERTTVLLADDHVIVRQGVRTFLETQPDLEVVGDAASGEDAVALAGEMAPDVAVVDLLMPGIGGVEAIRQLKLASPHTQVVALTSYHDDEHIFAALRAGALSYVLKDIAADALADVVRKAARGESVLHPRVAARVVRELRGDRDVPNLFVELSERELQVLRLIAAGLSNATIAKQLTISEKTVKGHVSNILGKLHILDRTKAAVLAWQQGLVQ
jgi:NarL family two-component system response regulator LiaR